VGGILPALAQEAYNEPMRIAASRRDTPRHPDHAREGVDDPEEQGRRGV